MIKSSFCLIMLISNHFGRHPYCGKPRIISGSAPEVTSSRDQKPEVRWNLDVSMNETERWKPREYQPESVI